MPEKSGRISPGPRKRDPRAGEARGSRADRRYGERNLLSLLLGLLFGLLFGLLGLLVGLLLGLLDLLVGLLLFGLGLGSGLVGLGGEGDEEQGGDCSGDRADHFELLGCGASVGAHPSSVGRSKGHAACWGGDKALKVLHSRPAGRLPGPGRKSPTMQNSPVAASLHGLVEGRGLR